jgi:kinesin family protein 4/21/27
MEEGEAPASPSAQLSRSDEIPVVVAVNIRPLIYDELMQGCRECLHVTEGEPQVRSSPDASIQLLKH